MIDKVTKSHLNGFYKTVVESCEVLQRAGHNELADKLAFLSGFVIGTVYENSVPDMTIDQIIKESKKGKQVT